MHVELVAAEYKNDYRWFYHGVFKDDIDKAEKVLANSVLHNDQAKDRIDQVNYHVKKLGDHAFDYANLLQVVVREDIDQIRHNGVVDLTQNMTKMIIASSLGVGAVVAFYQAAKAAVTIACAQDAWQDKQDYIAVYSCAAVAALCAVCSLLCYWSIN